MTYKEMVAYSEAAVKANKLGKVLRVASGKFIFEDLPEQTQEELREQAVTDAQSFLNKTDWYVVRWSETGVPVPPEITEKRAEMRTIISTLREEINDD
jgi:regulator of protease activity HflC (stomatin/prohibitin superfamily)